MSMFYSVSWYHNGVRCENTTCATNSSDVLFVSNAEGRHGGNYVLQAANQHGTTFSSFINLQLAGNTLKEFDSTNVVSQEFRCFTIFVKYCAFVAAISFTVSSLFC